MYRAAAVVLLLVLGTTLGVALALMAPVPGVHQTLEWLDTPRSVGPFSLDSETGAFDNQSLAGRWTIVLFGFLHCPDLCPTSLSQLATLSRRLAEHPIDAKVTYVFVSVDPDRDSVADVGQYVRHFDASIRGATGTVEQLTQLAGDLGIQFKVSKDAGDYTVAHSVTFSVIDPQGALRGRFRPGFDAPDLVQNLTARLKEAGA